MKIQYYSCLCGFQIWLIKESLSALQKIFLFPILTLWEIQIQYIISSIQESVFLQRSSMVSKPPKYYNSVKGKVSFFFSNVLLKKDIHVYLCIVQTEIKKESCLKYCKWVWQTFKHPSLQSRYWKKSDYCVWWFVCFVFPERSCCDSQPDAYSSC